MTKKTDQKKERYGQVNDLAKKRAKYCSVCERYVTPCKKPLRCLRGILSSLKNKSND